ncbi:MAG TPA: hypothetical protein VGB92_22835 [Longimicrobium sp.]|jgi:hypothetical protein
MSGVDEHATLRAVVASGRPETVSEEQIERLLAHAGDCTDCSAELYEFAATAILAQTPVVRFDPERSARVKERLLARTRVRVEPAAPPARLAKRHWIPHGSGWLAAAAMGVALITHHGFHEPLRAGWLVAAGFAIIALGLAVHSRGQTQRLAELEQRLGMQEHEGPDR